MSNQRVDVQEGQLVDQYSELFNAPVAVVEEGKGPVALKSMQIYPSAGALVKTCPLPLLKAHHRVTEISARRNFPVQFLGYAPLFSKEKIYPGPVSDWALMNLSKDPTYTNKQKLIVPATVAKDIQIIKEAGIDFPAIYIAHEIPKGSVKNGEKVPLELIAPPPPPESMQRVQTLSRTAETFWRRVADIIQVTVAAGSVAAAGAVMGATSFAGALAEVDPVLFGVLIDKKWQYQGQPIGLWYYITHWYWSATEG